MRRVIVKLRPAFYGSLPCENVATDRIGRDVWNATAARGSKYRGLVWKRLIERLIPSFYRIVNGVH